MTESTNRKRNKEPTGEVADPVHVIREGAIAASLWKRQSPSGFAYYDFTLSRSWKSMGTGKSGYSRSFFASNQSELIAVIQKTAAWLEAQSADSSRVPDQPDLASVPGEAAALDSFVN